MEYIYSFDFGILNWIYNNIHCDFLDFFMPLITALGDGGIFFILVSLILIITKKYRKIGITMALAIFFGFIIGNLTLKLLFARIRPYDINPNIILLVDKLSDFSFPSGHTLVAFEFASVTGFYNKKMGIYAYILAFTIAFSRLYLYVHFPTDVICGAILGVIFGFLSFRIVGFIYKKYRLN